MPIISQNTCIKTSDRPLETSRCLQLREGQTTLLSAPLGTRRCVKISFESGIARFSGSFNNHIGDITLGFCGHSGNEFIRLPDGTALLFEAMTNCLLHFSYVETCPEHQDLMLQWLFDLHLVRHPVGADSRLESLFRLLIKRFGIKQNNSETYLLPFYLGHSRMAELIGATRSTVTRQISRLRQQKYLLLDEHDGKFIISNSLIQNPIN